MSLRLAITLCAIPGWPSPPAPFLTTLSFFIQASSSHGFHFWQPEAAARRPSTLQDGLGFFCSHYLGSNPPRAQITSIMLTLSSLCSRPARMLVHPPHSASPCVPSELQPSPRWETQAADALHHILRFHFFHWLVPKRCLILVSANSFCFWDCI